MNTISLDAWIAGGGDVESVEPSPHEQAAGRMKHQQILMLLSPRQREIVLLKEVGYEKNREVAAIMQVSISTVEKELIKIRRELQSFRRAK